MLKNKWTALWNDEMFQGWGKTAPYFEGWYFKLIDEDQGLAFAVIPGISKSSKGDHAFIQVFDGKLNHSSYHRFSSDMFLPDSKKFWLTLDKSTFSNRHIFLDVPELKLDLKFENRVSWPNDFLVPGIMGWYAFMPFMQCYHGVVSLHHSFHGTLDYKGSSFKISNGKGYLEKDWGKSFPKSWIWMQTNHFKEQSSPTCCMASVAHIPWLGTNFIGFLACFLFEGVVHKFTTYNGSKMKAKIIGKKMHVGFKRGAYELLIEAHKKEGTQLVSPIEGEMVGKVEESLESELSIIFMKSEITLFAGTGQYAGLEIAGEFEELLTDVWRK